MVSHVKIQSVTYHYIVYMLYTTNSYVTVPKGIGFIDSSCMVLVFLKTKSNTIRPAKS
jgi:hypothetical protein